MFRRFLIFAILPAAFMLAGCSHDEPTAPAVPAAVADLPAGFAAEALAATILQASGWETAEDADTPVLPDAVAEKAAGPLLLDVGREELSGQVAHYWWTFRAGPGDRDLIRLHRVVKERRPGRPVRSRENVFLLHGDAVPFEPLFLFGAALPGAPDDLGAAHHLAADGVDVWGMDQPWKLYDLEEADFSAMAGWGLEYSADRLENALVVARLLRIVTGCGRDRLNLLGYSSGVATGYVLLQREAQRPSYARNIAGFVAVDLTFVAPTAPDPGACGLAEFYRSEYESGVYEDQYFGVYFLELGGLAYAEPDVPSPYFEGLTNLEAALAWGVFAEEGATEHLVAGTFSAEFVPTGLQYTDVSGYVEFLRHAAPYDPTRFVYEVAAVGCGEEDSPFDDALAAVQVPVLGIAAAGGAGEDSFHALSLLGSSDVTTLLIQLHPDGEAELDFGHVDLFTADEAPGLVWEPIRSWIGDHVPAHGAGPWHMGQSVF